MSNIVDIGRNFDAFSILAKNVNRDVIMVMGDGAGLRKMDTELRRNGGMAKEGWKQN